MFESFANSERYKTVDDATRIEMRLRALLIQKDTKPIHVPFSKWMGLRALLIQKDTKQRSASNFDFDRLRALLIQKDTKPLSPIPG